VLTNGNAGANAGGHQMASVPRHYVAVVGPGAEADPASALLEAGREVGRELALAGAAILCGGLGGVMEAVSLGAQEGGGLCVGLLPGEQRDEGNRHLSLALATGLGEARNALIVQASDAVIAIGEGYGTLSEIALALRAGKHVVGLQTWDLATSDARMHVAVGAAEAVRLALARAAEP
jgi:uncharacterized protein (TIGR00725 family)